MAFHYPDGIHHFCPRLALTAFIFLSLPVLIFTPADSVILLKECMTLLTLLTFTSAFSGQLPVSHKHLAGSGFFRPLLETTFWLIQHCCLIDHPDQVLKADAPTTDLPPLSD